MKVSIKKFLEDAGITEFFYPGKRLVRQYPQPGEFKSHSIVLDWLNPAKIRLDLRAGLSGHTPPKDLLKKYPVSYQTPTYVEIAVNAKAKASNTTEEGDSGDEDGKEGNRTSGKKGGGGGGKGFRLARQMGEERGGAMSRLFGQAMEGAVPEMGRVTEMVVMGMKIGTEAMESVLDVLAHQILTAKVSATDLLAKAGKFVTRYTPPAFLAPKGDETAVYKYDREKNEPMFGAMTPG